MLIPEAWQNHESMDPAQGVTTVPLNPRGGAVGRAGVVVTDGVRVGSVLTAAARHFWQTEDGLVVLRVQRWAWWTWGPAVVRRPGGTRHHVPRGHPGPGGW
ncbi:hypothetical protein QJS66_02190 [Kocuria rhizophila]|nr:hypothetical protein QJS66_02190 [Kocuria rhizophila]